MLTAGQELAGTLRARIVRGRWKPGGRLPDRKALAGELGTCQRTLQDALDQLVEEGFVEVGPRKKGTLVATHPPHLSRYRLIFPFGPDDWGQFWHALEAAARELTTERREFAPFYGLNGHRSIDEFQAVVNEAHTRSVAGLIFASSADELLGTPLFDQPGIPRVAIAVEGQLPGIPKVFVDLEDFMMQSVKHLVARGRRRLALLSADGSALFERALAAHGLSARSVWEQFAGKHNPQAARHVVELLMHPGQSERPDGLIVSDDNLLTAAGEGLLAAGVRVPEDVNVVAITNFPNLVPCAVPVTRIGFDIPALLDLLVERLEQVRRGETPPENTLVPAVLAPANAAEPPLCDVRNNRIEEGNDVPFGSGDAGLGTCK
jgi:DNA-binding LacI/PurR family transcriptional regulator